MADPISPYNLFKGLPPLGPASPPIPGAAPRGTGPSFQDALLSSLDEVNRLQKEANTAVERLAVGETSNVAEVFSAVRKADIAFSMLMEMRNKLVDAYNELQQMRV